MKKIKKISISLLVFLILGLVSLVSVSNNSNESSAESTNSSIRKLSTLSDGTSVVSSASDILDITGTIDTSCITDYFDTNNVYALPEELESSDTISVIISLDIDPLYDVYKEMYSSITFKEFMSTEAATRIENNISQAVDEKIRVLEKSGLNFTLGEKYDTLIAGFEIEIKAGKYDALEELYPNATLILGDTYEEAETEVVTNDVDVYDTGIFDSSSCEYQGDGVVVAILDTGLDYTHTAFSVDNFTTSNEAWKLSTIAEKISDTVASSYSTGLTAEDVYVSKKVPYAYDYADKDSDVSPINSEHGTHVAGIIAGKDDTITGVAPNAQLAIFKVFSDHQDGAKTSWLIAALEDAVTLGVDIINMSLGSGCGFTREVDKENVNAIYDKVEDAGIELIASAANSYNATMGSTKNGNNGLTSNPDSGTVGAPSTYEAALSVASVNGELTSYLKLNDTIIYFNEAYTNSADVTKDFVSDVLSTVGGVSSYNFEYVVIPGVGRSSDYPEDDSYYQGKIVLVKRGTTTFEDKCRVALTEKGAAGIIIYNNLSGTISMSVGANIGAVCSISQDDGELLVKSVDPTTGIGHIYISQTQKAGPFMSDFSSWGPTSDLKIKPEITAHGGNILSAVPGQSYEKLSGTSMAAPNLTGAATLIIQYVKYSGKFGTNLTTKEVTNIVNQLMMSTADIIYDKNGLPSSVRKQGSGLVSISKSTSAESYITTYDTDGNKMERTKFELGDDKTKSGVYTMTFDINNITSSAQTYDLSAICLTEGVSTTYTSHSDTTVTMNEYSLSGAVLKVVSGGNGDGNKVTVNANSTLKVTVQLTLSDSDKAYLDESFENGMYVEGYLVATNENSEGVSLNVPYLAFYGDWTQAPIFDEEYYDTNVDEINAGIDDADKLMADAYATRVIGGLYTDYISTLGTYYFVQDPSNTQIAASKEHIAISNQNLGTSGSTISSLRSVSAGLLRNAKEIDIVITEDSTGEEIYSDIVYNQRKSFSSGSTIYSSSIDIKYDILEHNLKNNTRYTVTLTAYIDYGEKEDQNNARNTFTFPFYVDFEAPIITDVVYRTEYDKTTKKTSLYADLYVYDNDYAMALQLGQIIEAPEGSEYKFTMTSFGKYATPVYSSFNSTSVVTVELTDYVSQIRNSCGYTYDENGNFTINYNNNSFIVNVYDYAMNSATYEIELPDEIESMAFNAESVSISPNETLDLSTVLTITPSETWIQTLEFTSSDEEVVSIVNNVLVGKKSGTATITATGKDEDGNYISTSLEIKVLSEGEEGYVGNYTVPVVNKFSLDGYKTVKAYYSTDSDDRDIGVTDGEYSFGTSVELKMYPSEQVRIEYTLDTYDSGTVVKFKSSNTKYATVTEDGLITAQAKGSTTIMATVYDSNGKATIYTSRISITVKDPFNITSIYLYSYKGLGGVVEIPANRGITTIYNYAFSNYEYVNKDTSAGDVIDDEDPYYIKQSYLGDDTITKVIIPEGVTTINSYAFANLTALEEVVLPSTLTRIGVGAFYNCTKLKTINLGSVKFINEYAFYNCPFESADLSSAVNIGQYAFENTKLSSVDLSSTLSIAEGAFYNCQNLDSLKLSSKSVKIAKLAFASCPNLTEVTINAAVIPSYCFYNDTELKKVTLGSDVSVVNEYAFSGTSVESFNVSAKNSYLSTAKDGKLLLSKGGETLILAAPNYVESGNKITLDESITAISQGALSGNVKVFYVEAPGVITIDNFAFAYCTNLRTISMPSLVYIGDYAFYNTSLNDLGDISNVSSIGSYAFAGANITSLALSDGTVIGSYAFEYNISLETITLGNNVTVGEYAFYNPVGANTYEQTSSFTYYTVYQYEVKDEDGNVVETNSYYRYDFTSGVYSKLKTVTAGDNLKLETGAFYGNGKLESVHVGENAVIGDYAFYSAASLSELNFENVTSIGNYSFAGYRTMDYWLEDNVWRYAYEKEYNDGIFENVAYVYSCFAPCFTSVDLTNVQSVGVAAFMGEQSLKNIILSDSMTSVGEYMFANCSSLESITLKSQINEIGEYAFYNSAIKSIDLSNIDVIGQAAFYNTKLTEITLKNDVTVGDYAFYYVRTLKTVNNDENISSIGSYAFSLTGVKEFDLTNAAEVGDFAFANSDITSVTFGNKLVTLGENPFYACEIVSFANGKEETYDVSDTVKVIDGVLYKVVNTGYVLVSYPLMSTLKEYTIDENTSRISASAFAYSGLESITLSNILKSIGDKAFYGCANLKVVTFKSYDAPLLEETYSTSYANYANLPINGYYGTYEGLAISKYYMWNVASDYTNYYYGANFKDYIGHETGDIIMVKPANGNNYDSFIFKQYFAYEIDGKCAPTEATLNVINLINQIPSYIQLSDEAVIVAARAAYATITSTEQQALVENYSVLVKAESNLAYLKSKEEPASDPEPEPEPEPEPTPEEEKKGCKGTLVTTLITSITLLGSVVVLSRKKKEEELD